MNIMKRQTANGLAVLEHTWLPPHQLAAAVRLVTIVVAQDTDIAIASTKVSMAFAMQTHTAPVAQVRQLAQPVLAK